MADGRHDLPHGHLLLFGDPYELQRVFERGELSGRVGALAGRQEGVRRRHRGLVQQQLAAEAPVTAVV